MITILCPTRGRPDMCKRMVESARATSSTKIEIILGIGAIDPEYNMAEYYGGYDIRMADKTIVFTQPSVVYVLNEMVKHASGELLVIAGDDTIFSTQGWDKALIDHYDNLANRIHVYSLRDSRDENGTPHPIVTKQFVKAMGYIYPPIFFHFYADTWLVNIAKANGCFTHMKDYLLAHDKPSDKGIFDDTYKFIRNNGWLNRDESVHKTCGHFLEIEKQRLGTHMRIADSLYQVSMRT